jgi:hypothetical protein
VLNPELHLATVNQRGRLALDLTVEHRATCRPRQRSARRPSGDRRRDFRARTEVALDRHAPSRRPTTTAQPRIGTDGSISPATERLRQPVRRCGRGVSLVADLRPSPRAPELDEVSPITAASPDLESCPIEGWTCQAAPQLPRTAQVERLSAGPEVRDDRCHANWSGSRRRVLQSSAPSEALSRVKGRGPNHAGFRQRARARFGPRARSSCWRTSPTCSSGSDPRPSPGQGPAPVRGELITRRRAAVCRAAPRRRGHDKRAAPERSRDRPATPTATAATCGSSARPHAGDAAPWPRRAGLVLWSAGRRLRSSQQDSFSGAGAAPAGGALAESFRQGPWPGTVKPSSRTTGPASTGGPPAESAPSRACSPGPRAVPPPPTGAPDMRRATTPACGGQVVSFDADPASTRNGAVGPTGAPAPGWCAPPASSSRT